MYDEDDLLPISAIQHFVFCQRQAALIHIEQEWDENVFTVEGRQLHQNVDQAVVESRRDIRIVKGLLLRSLRLGLSGRADVVEFHRQLSSEKISDSGLSPASEAIWLPFPVEYKRGKARYVEGSEIQLCAQAICLEEMLGVEVPQGALYYGKSARRYAVAFDDLLREKAEAAAHQLHQFINRGQTPAARYGKKCESCSLIAECMPKLSSTKKSASDYLKKTIQTIQREAE
jgi:CRISPR-associated exonuclease Cas4